MCMIGDVLWRLLLGSFVCMIGDGVMLVWFSLLILPYMNNFCLLILRRMITCIYICMFTYIFMYYLYSFAITIIQRCPWRTVDTFKRNSNTSVASTLHRPHHEMLHGTRIGHKQLQEHADHAHFLYHFARESRGGDALCGWL